MGSQLHLPCVPFRGDAELVAGHEGGRQGQAGHQPAKMRPVIDAQHAAGQGRGDANAEIDQGPEDQLTQHMGPSLTEDAPIAHEQDDLRADEGENSAGSPQRGDAGIAGNRAQDGSAQPAHGEDGGEAEVTEDAFQDAAKVIEHVCVEEQVQCADGIQGKATPPAFHPDPGMQEDGREKAINLAFLEYRLREVPAGLLNLLIELWRSSAQDEERHHYGQGCPGEVRWGIAQGEARPVGVWRWRGWSRRWRRRFEGMGATFRLGHGMARDA